MKHSILILLAISLIISSCGKKEENSTSNQLKQKELELKEKELELKEKQLEEQNSNQNSNGSGKYPEASSKLLTSKDLEDLTKYDLKIMRNEIFARHGYIFKTDDMRNYFNSQTWYKPLYDDVTSKLSSTEKTNIDLIKSVENGQNISKKEDTETQKILKLSGLFTEDSYKAQYVMDKFGKGTVEYSTSLFGGAILRGKYKVNGNKVTFNFDDGQSYTVTVDEDDYKYSFYRGSTKYFKYK